HFATLTCLAWYAFRLPVAAVGVARAAEDVPPEAAVLRPQGGPHRQDGLGPAGPVPVLLLALRPGAGRADQRLHRAAGHRQALPPPPGGPAPRPRGGGRPGPRRPPPARPSGRAAARPPRPAPAPPRRAPPPGRRRRGPGRLALPGRPPAGRAALGTDPAGEPG